MSDCLENRYSQFDIQSPRESISRSANVGVFTARARQLQVSINQRAHHDWGLTRNTKRFPFIQVNISEDPQKHTHVTSLLTCATDNYSNFTWIESRPDHWSGVTRPEHSDWKTRM